MSKIFRILAGLIPVVVLILLPFAGCRSGGEKGEKQVTEVELPRDMAQVQQDVQQAEKIFNALPSPLESAMLIKAAGAPFDRNYMNPVENTKMYTTSRSRALNLGIYTCDLSFASLYDQTQLIIDYMNAAKSMADGLGILEAINQQTMETLEENINNKEVIMDIISQTFLNSNSYLEDNDQSAVASIVLIGGWMEGLYISTQLVDLDEFRDNKLVKTIIDQKLSIDLIINLLDANKGNPAVDELITQMTKLKTVFDKIDLKSTPVKTEVDKTSNVTVLKSDVTSEMSVETFKELSALVANIRSTFVK